MPHVPRRNRSRVGNGFGGAALVGVLMVACLFSGLVACGSDEPRAKPSPSSAVPTAPPDLDTTEPTAPTDLAETKQSAEEFAGYFAEVVQHAIRIRDIAPVAALARDQAACSSCSQVAAYIDGLEKDALWETGGDLEIGRLRVRSMGDTAYNVKGPVVYPRIGFVDVRGKEKASQAVTDYRLDVDLLWDAGRDRWQVDDYSLFKRGKT